MGAKMAHATALGRPSTLAALMYRVRSDAPTGSVVTRMFPAATLKPLGPDDYLLLCHLRLAPVLGLAGGVVARTFAGWPHGHEATGSGEASSD